MGSIGLLELRIPQGPVTNPNKDLGGSGCCLDKHLIGWSLLRTDGIDEGQERSNVSWVRALSLNRGKAYPPLPA